MKLRQLVPFALGIHGGLILGCSKDTKLCDAQVPYKFTYKSVQPSCIFSFMFLFAATSHVA